MDRKPVIFLSFANDRNGQILHELEPERRNFIMNSLNITEEVGGCIIVPVQHSQIS